MQASENIRVSVIVACRNERKHIRNCLDSLCRQALGDIKIEVLIADGMSDDGTRQILDLYRRIVLPLRVIDNRDKIASAGLNAAIRGARGEIIIRMDAHSEYAPDYIRHCLEVLDETSADNVGGPALTRADGYLGRRSPSPTTVRSPVAAQSFTTLNMKATWTPCPTAAGANRPWNALDCSMKASVAIRTTN